MAIERRNDRRWGALMRELAAFDATPGRVVSLYLDVCWDDEQQRARTRLAIKDQLRRLRGNGGAAAIALDPALAKDLERVEGFVEERIHQRVHDGDRGLAMFLCSARRLERVVRSPLRLPNLLLVEPMPALRPLVMAAGERGFAIAAIVDAMSTRLYELSPDGAAAVGGVEGTVPKRHGRGGWSQLKLQHHRIDEMDHHHEEAARAIARLLAATDAGSPPARAGEVFAEAPMSRPWVLLAGPNEAVASLERHLPAFVRERARRVEEVSAADAEPDALDGLSRALAEAVREEASGRVRAVQEAANAGGRGSCGARSVVDSVNRSRVNDLLLAEDFCGDGWRCPSCGAIGLGASARCDACGGEVRPVELGEALVHAAVERDARVSILPRRSPLDLLGGVAAQLRF